jgi:hypothetical protein
MLGDMRLRLCTSRLGIVAPHPPLRGTFSPWEKDAPRELRQRQDGLGEGGMSAESTHLFWRVA